MLNSSIFPKSHLSKNRVLILILSSFLLLGFQSLELERIWKSIESVQSSHTRAPLLLNAGVVNVQEAEVSIILWTEDGTIPIETWTQLPMPDWIWSRKEINTKDGNAATLTGHRIINRNEENMLYKWYTSIAPVLAKDGVQIYIDERIPEGIDISAYLSKTQTNPSQWYLLDNQVSIAGYQSSLGTSVMAGRDRVNIQLLSRGNDTDGYTVLAIPVLLKEF